MHFLDNLQTITQEGNMETRRMTPFFFSSTFSALTVTFIFVFENSQNWFWCGPPSGPFWSVKYLKFGQGPPIRATRLILCFVPQVGPKGGVSSWAGYDHIFWCEIHICQSSLALRYFHWAPGAWACNHEQGIWGRR